MPNKRAHPNKIFNKILDEFLDQPLPRLNKKQCARLEKIAGLPSAALPKIQKLARDYVLFSSIHPSNTEVRAMLKILLKRVSALQDDFSEADAMTQVLILVIYNQCLGIIHKASNDPINALSLDRTLAILKMAIETALEQARTQHLFPGKVAHLTRAVRNTFKKLDVPFSLRNDSPAVSTVSEIANMVRPTSRESVRHAVWLEMGTKERPRLKPNSR
jgi:hypothetical protein